MTKSRHTSGPWGVGKTASGYFYIADSEGKWITQLFNTFENFKDYEERMANAQIIALAPEMLKVLQNILPHMYIDEDSHMAIERIVNMAQLKTYFCREYPEEGCEICRSLADAREVFNCDCEGCEGPISLKELKEKTRTRRKRQ